MVLQTFTNVKFVKKNCKICKKGLIGFYTDNLLIVNYLHNKNRGCKFVKKFQTF